MRVDADDFARPCGDGKMHHEIKEILIEPGAVNALEEAMSEGFLKEYISPLLICDTNTCKATEKLMEDIFDRCQVLVLDPDDQEIYSCLLDLDLACEIKSLVAKEFPEVVCGIYGGEHWVVDDIRDPWVIQEQGITHLIPETGDIREIFGKEGGIHKFLFMGDEEAVIRTENRLKERLSLIHI